MMYHVYLDCSEPELLADDLREMGITMREVPRSDATEFSCASQEVLRAFVTRHWDAEAAEDIKRI